ncbi:MAG: polyprenyl synthetase family protein [Bacteroidota bacterium]|nr:polyprenyl synthetase family protein [Bacteroidota bacterium]MDP3145633.1 polyprenyl synthetase family protein [Bacteroidota bacterium]
MKNYQLLLELFLKHLEGYKSTLSSKSPKELYEPENYILSLGGKRLRPLLSLIACDLFDKDPKHALNSALAVELFHNFSLMHDDILDAAPLRRNKETVHIKWNTNIAILSGDVMLVKASQVLENYDFKEFKKLSILFNKTAIEVCEGQQYDMNFENQKNVSVDDYIQMITNKTAVLLGCSLKMGAINANASEEDQTNLFLFGKHLGIGFQLLDDLLDAFAQDSEKFGKQIGGDIIANKKTFLLLKALELANEKQKKEITKSLKEKDNSKKIETILAIYTELNIKELCQQEADKHTQIAIDYLSKVSASNSKKENLKQFAKELLKRQV